MKKLNRWVVIRNWGMPQKFIVAYIFLFVVPIFFISTVTYRHYARSIQNSTTAYVSQIARETLTKLDGYVTDMEAATLTPYYIPEMQQALRAADYDLPQIANMSYYIQLINRDWNSKYLVYLFDSAGHVYHNMKPYNVRQAVESQYPYFRSVAYAANGSAVILPTQKVIDMNGQERYYLTVVRCVKELTDYQIVGITVVDMDIGVLDGTILQLDENTGGKTIIIDAEKNVIDDSDKTLLARKYADTEMISKASGREGSFQITENGKVSMCVYTSSVVSGMELIVTIPLKTLLSGAVGISRLIILTTSITGVVAIFFFIFLSYTITRPLRKLSRLMQKVQDGDLDAQFRVRYADEVGLVAVSFNRMVVRLKELINEVYVIRLREKQTELDALQGQINPHFIYNTLETIRMTAVLRRQDEIAEIAIIFGKLLRYSVNRINEIVTIQDELKHLENYIYLQNKRFPGKFLLDIAIPDDVRGMKSIKLIFQPIVENAIIHGLEQKKEAGHISVTCGYQDEFILFTVSDDGNGIDGDTLAAVNARLVGVEGEPAPGRHIGLKNVSERIKLYYGDQYGITLVSRPGEGTAVTMRLPRNP